MPRQGSHAGLQHVHRALIFMHRNAVKVTAKVEMPAIRGDICAVRVNNLSDWPLSRGMM